MEYKQVSRESRLKAGRWKSQASTHELKYANAVDYISMRVKAGFPQQGGSFYVRRAMLRPSEALKEQVFSTLTELRTAVKTGAIPKEDVDETLEGFLEVIDHLSETLLQDAAVMYEQIKSNVLFSYKPFTTPEFWTYRAELLSAMQSAPNVELLQTQRRLAEKSNLHTAAILSQVRNDRIYVCVCVYGPGVLRPPATRVLCLVAGGEGRRELPEVHEWSRPNSAVGGPRSLSFEAAAPPAARGPRFAAGPSGPPAGPHKGANCRSIQRLQSGALGSTELHRFASRR